MTTRSGAPPSWCTSVQEVQEQFHFDSFSKHGRHLQFQFLFPKWRKPEEVVSVTKKSNDHNFQQTIDQKAKLRIEFRAFTDATDLDFSDPKTFRSSLKSNKLHSNYSSQTYIDYVSEQNKLTAGWMDSAARHMLLHTLFRVWVLTFTFQTRPELLWQKSKSNLVQANNKSKVIQPCWVTIHTPPH